MWFIPLLHMLCHPFYVQTLHNDLCPSGSGTGRSGTCFAVGLLSVLAIQDKDNHWVWRFGDILENWDDYTLHSEENSECNALITILTRACGFNVDLYRMAIVEHPVWVAGNVMPYEGFVPQLSIIFGLGRDDVYRWLLLALCCWGQCCPGVWTYRQQENTQQIMLRTVKCISWLGVTDTGRFV